MSEEIHEEILHTLSKILRYLKFMLGNQASQIELECARQGVSNERYEVEEID